MLRVRFSPLQPFYIISHVGRTVAIMKEKKKFKFNKKRLLCGVVSVVLSLCLLFCSLPCSAATSISKVDSADSLYNKGSIVFNRAQSSGRIVYSGDDFATANIWKFQSAAVADNTLIEYGGSSGFSIIQFGTADTFQLDCTTSYSYSNFYTMLGWIDFTYNPSRQPVLSCVNDFEIVFRFAGSNISKTLMNVNLSNYSVEICGARYRWTEQTNSDGSPQYVDYVFTDAGGFNGHLRFDDDLNLICKGYFNEPVILSAIRVSFTLSVQVNSVSTIPRLWFRSNNITGTLATRDEYVLHAMSRYYTDVLEAYSKYFNTTPNSDFRAIVRKYTKAMQLYLYPISNLDLNPFFSDLFVFLGNSVVVSASIGVAVFAGSRVFKAIRRRGKRSDD